MNKLNCLESIAFEPLAHQVRTAEKVLNLMEGRAILADEVGLGKTIEAGLVIKELLERKMIKRVLILVPASLAPQWCMEMKQKFDLYFYHNRRDHNWTYFNFIVASIDRAKRQEQLGEILKANFDLLVVDEAHRLKNSATANYQAVKKINPRYLLLLTATPMQNNLKELYNLVELVNPHLFNGFANFKTRFIGDDEQIKSIDQLHHALLQVMIRNHKSDLKVKLPPRRVELIAVNLSPEERMLYQGVNDYIKSQYRKRLAEKISVLSLVMLQKEICSSTFAAQATLEKMGLTDLAQIASEIKFNQKAAAVEQIIKASNTKTIVFTEFKATQQYLARFLFERGISSLCYNGDLKPWQRVWSRQAFQEQYPVLISTEAGGEGVNLQRANLVINYDLPWNPMKVEQRIGRVHRLGQESPVKIYNLFAEDTVEELILSLLRKKISIFQETVGDLDCIVDGELEAHQDIMSYLYRDTAG